MSVVFGRIRALLICVCGDLVLISYILDIMVVNSFSGKLEEAKGY